MRNHKLRYDQSLWTIVSSHLFKCEEDVVGHNCNCKKKDIVKLVQKRTSRMQAPALSNQKTRNKRCDTYRFILSTMFYNSSSVKKLEKMSRGLEASSRPVWTPEFPSKQWCLRMFSLFDQTKEGVPYDAWCTSQEVRQSPIAYLLKAYDLYWRLCYWNGLRHWHLWIQKKNVSCVR